MLRSLNPATGETFAEFPAMDDAAVRSVVGRAREVASWWAGRGWKERERHLLRWAAWLVDHSAELTELLHLEQGKPRGSAFVELVPTLEQIRWAARNAKKVLGERRVWPGFVMSNHTARIEYRPYGVVGIIGPWNYPVFTPAGQMMAYALAAGNTVVLKPSEFTPAIGEFVVNSFAAANPDAPTGVVSLVTGFGATGAALCASGVDKIGFTGSTATGKRVLAACAESLVPTVMECGGKDAMIVADDADVAAAAKAAAWGAMTNAGQTCVGIEQVYVVAEVRDRFVTELRKRLRGIAPGTADNAPYGPMTMPGQLDLVRTHVKDALASGGWPAVGGADSVHEPYVDPVVIVDPADDCSAVLEETFGPTLVLRTVSNVDEAIRLLNARPFGLGASVFSRAQGETIARRIRAGQIAINCALSFVGIPSLPFGGTGASGFGRVHGADGLREFAVPTSYARQLYAIPGMDTTTLRPKRITVKAIEVLMRVRHGRAS